MECWKASVRRWVWCCCQGWIGLALPLAAGWIGYSQRISGTSRKSNEKNKRQSLRAGGPFRHVEKKFLLDFFHFPYLFGIFILWILKDKKITMASWCYWCFEQIFYTDFSMNTFLTWASTWHSRTKKSRRVLMITVTSILKARVVNPCGGLRGV